MKSSENILVEGNPHMTVLNALYAAFDHFNKHFYAGRELSRPIINLGPAGRKNALGWFLQEGWETEGGNIHEINMSPEYLKRDPDEILETLLHEMAHMRNAVDDIKDCNKAQYHNKAFKDAAEYLGLTVEKGGYRGWAWTALGEGAKAAINVLPFDKAVFNIARPGRKSLKENPYITIALKKEDWASALETLKDLTGTEGNSAAVKACLEHALNTINAD